jgi:hypothetical protein
MILGGDICVIAPNLTKESYIIYVTLRMSNIQEWSLSWWERNLETNESLGEKVKFEENLNKVNNWSSISKQSNKKMGCGVWGIWNLVQRSLGSILDPKPLNLTIKVINMMILYWIWKIQFVAEQQTMKSSQVWK